MRYSSGCLLYRLGAEGIEVLLVHPSGNYNRRSPWGIPKGEIDAGENAEQAARRETWEESGVTVLGTLVDLGHIDYTRSKKRVHCYAGPAPEDAAPTTASWEVDQVEFVVITRARQIMHPDQVAFLDRLEALLTSDGP